jgi:hypothetical protein
MFPAFASIPQTVTTIIPSVRNIVALATELGFIFTDSSKLFVNLVSLDRTTVITSVTVILITTITVAVAVLMNRLDTASVTTIRNKTGFNSVNLVRPIIGITSITILQLGNLGLDRTEVLDNITKTIGDMNTLKVLITVFIGVVWTISMPAIQTGAIFVFERDLTCNLVLTNDRIVLLSALKNIVIAKRILLQIVHKEDSDIINGSESTMDDVVILVMNGVDVGKLWNVV